MMFQSTDAFLPIAEDAGRRVAHLRHVLDLVGQVAGRTATADDDAELDEAALFAGAYALALPVAQRRFDALAEETATWAAIGVEALLESGNNPAAAARLTAELDGAVRELRVILRL